MGDKGGDGGGGGGGDGGDSGDGSDSGGGGGDLGVGGDQFGLGGDSGGGGGDLGVGSDQFGLGGGGDSSFVDTSGGSGGVIDDSLSGADQGSVDTSGGTLGGSTLADLAAAITGGGFDTGGLGGGFGPQSAGFDAPAGAAPLDGGGGAGLDITPGGTIGGAGLSDLMQAITGGDNLAGGFGKGGGAGFGTGAGTGGIPGVDAGTGGLQGAGLNDLMNAINAGGNLAGGFGPQGGGFNANFGASPMSLGAGSGGGGGSALSDLAAAVAGGNIGLGGLGGGLGNAPVDPSSPFGVDPNSGLPTPAPDIVGSTGSAPDVLAQKALTAGDEQVSFQDQKVKLAPGGELSGKQTTFIDRLLQAVTGVSPAAAADASSLDVAPPNPGGSIVPPTPPGTTNPINFSPGAPYPSLQVDPFEFTPSPTASPNIFNPYQSADQTNPPAATAFSGGPQFGGVASGTPQPFKDYGATPTFEGDGGLPTFGGVGSPTPQAPPGAPPSGDTLTQQDRNIAGIQPELRSNPPPSGENELAGKLADYYSGPGMLGGSSLPSPGDTPDTFASRFGNLPPAGDQTTDPFASRFGNLPPAGDQTTDPFASRFGNLPPAKEVGPAPGETPAPAPDVTPPVPTPRERPPEADQTTPEDPFNPAPWFPGVPGTPEPPAPMPNVPLPAPRPPGADQQPAPQPDQPAPQPAAPALPPGRDIPSLPPGTGVPQQPGPQQQQAPQQQQQAAQDAQDAQETITGVPQRETPQGRRQGSGIAGAVANLLGIGGSPQTGRQGSLHDTIANAMGGGSLGNFVASAMLQAGVPAAIALLSRGRGGGFPLTGAPAAMGALGRGTAAAVPQMSRNLFPGSGLMVPIAAGQILDRSGQSGQTDQSTQGGAGYPYQRSPPAPAREPRPPQPAAQAPPSGYTARGGPGVYMPVPQPQRPQSVQSLVQRGQVSPTVGWIAQRGGHTEGVGAPQLQPEFASRLAAAGQAYERETGQKATFGETGRSRDVQARYYANFQSGQGGLAAPPGASRHEQGQATDIPNGPFQNWMHRNAARFGIQGLRDPRDPNHFQLDRNYTGPQYASL